jgi:phenylalanyl-tRNA synthetase alpha chain
VTTTELEQKVASLHRLERNLLKVLSEGSSKPLADAAKQAGIELDQARRAAGWLSSKGLVTQIAKEEKYYSLEPEGYKAAEIGLPEVRLARELKKNNENKEISVKDVSSSLGLKDEEVNVALGRAKRAGWVETFSRNGLLFLRRTDKEVDSAEQNLLEKLAKEPIEKSSLTEKESRTLSELKKRPRLISERLRRAVALRLTHEGSVALEKIPKEAGADKITVEMLREPSGSFPKLRPIDVTSPSPKLFPGKKHFVQAFVEEVREIFVSLGFEEVEGPIVQPTFWNFDALFIPQNHPAREMQDTFYLKSVKARNFAPAEVIDRIAQVHERGGNTGSKGWGYEWKIEEAERVVLRTHTTAVTVRYLADRRPEEAKIFTVGKVFRNEKVTFKSLVEFFQIEGIVVGRDVTVRDMMGILTKFYSKLGLSKVKFWPTFFPYTEPSFQSMVFYEPLNKWIELCGMGIFRPEVTLPLGVSNPVLAWGGGLERLIMLRYGIKDIRELYRNDLAWLRSVNLCQ